MRGLTSADKVREGQLLNAITVDVEDWLQSTIDPHLPLTDRFRANTQKVLAAFAAHGVRGTFFVLGLAAEKDPQLVREILAAGHDVQSHGYGHELLYHMSPFQFRADLDRSKKLLEDLIGQEIYGYRAPAFSITRQTLWALDTLVEAGFRYDSSIFPLRTRRYGVDGAPRYPHVLKTSAGHEIKELPVASYEFAGRRIPTGGGGYFRLLPYIVLRRGVRQLNAAGYAATVYMHPYEYNPAEFDELNLPIPWQRRLHQSLGRRLFPGRVDRLLGEFRFGAAQDVIAAISAWPQHTYAGRAPETAEASGTVSPGAP